jgi:hypothetical protein
MTKKRVCFLVLILAGLMFVGKTNAADLDLGSSDYPSSLDTNPSPQTGTDDTNHLPGNGAIDAAINIQTELGTDPAQGKSTVKAYMQTEHDTNGEHTFKNVYCFESVDIAANSSAIVVPAKGVDRYITGSATWDPSSIANGAEEAKEITVTGAALGEMVFVSFSIDTTDLALTAQVTATNTVTALLYNNTGGAIDLGSGTVKAKVLTNGSTYTANEYEMPWAGSIVGVSIYADDTITSGTCYGDPTVNGTASGLQAQVDVTNTIHHANSQAKDTDAFSANDRLGVKLTSSATFAPAATTSCIICVNVTFND